MSIEAVVLTPDSGAVPGTMSRWAHMQRLAGELGERAVPARGPHWNVHASSGDANIASRVGDPVMTVSGTPPYQAPDVDYTRWDVSTDLFAVGVTLYELLCNGEHPYKGRKPMVGEDVRDPKQVRPDVCDDVAAFLLKSCAPYRDQRFTTAVEMREALEGLRGVCDEVYVSGSLRD